MVIMLNIANITSFFLGIINNSQTFLVIFNLFPVFTIELTPSIKEAFEEHKKELLRALLSSIGFAYSLTFLLDRL